MKNLVQNITADASWQEVASIPKDCRYISLQARTAADMSYRFRGQDTYWTVKSGHVRTIEGRWNNGDLEVQAANGIIIELELSTSGAIV